MCANLAATKLPSVLGAWLRRQERFVAEVVILPEAVGLYGALVKGKRGLYDREVCSKHYILPPEEVIVPVALRHCGAPQQCKHGVDDTEVCSRPLPTPGVQARLA